MAEVKVSELATSVGIPVERLLKQMKESGLAHTTEDALVSDDEKQQLLRHLKGDSEEEVAAPRKITLKRKTLSTLKTGSGGSRKTVNIEVRKKRTYVKRTQEELVDDASESVLVEDGTLDEAVVDAPVAEELVTEELVTEELVVEEAPAAVEEPVAVEEPAPARRSFVDDLEEKRLAAHGRRSAANAAEKAALEARGAEKLAAAEAKEKEAKRTAKPAIKPKLTKDAPKQDDSGKHRKKGRRTVSLDDDDQSRSKRTGKSGKKGVGSKKNSRADMYQLAEEGSNEEFVKRRKLARAKHSSSNQHGFKKPVGSIVHIVEIPENIIVSELAQRMNVKAGGLIKQLMKMGVMATINQPLDQETAQLLVEEMGHEFTLVSVDDVENQLEQDIDVGDKELHTRAPIVTVMGHVDHGKTSLLDYIRESKVASGEAGGITQHIGAYRVPTPQGDIAFLDTPGHAAFTAMRARGAQCTDVVILVVAADDGVMPQTEEAILHSRAAGVPIVVAINKCDKESADPERVKNELSAKGVIPEDWGGDTQFIEVSAHTGKGIDTLLEAVTLQAELLELKAVVDAPARGVVVESRIDKGRGVVATLLVQQGTFNQGDLVLAGQSYGRARALTNERGEQVKSVGPSSPIEILGLDVTPSAGDDFIVLDNERKAREMAEFRVEKERADKLQRHQAAKLENMFADMDSGQKKVLSVVLKTDVRGSLEAIQSSLNDIGNDEVEVQIVSSGVGGITDNDVNLALTTGAIIIGFNVRAGGSTRRMAESESVEIRYYSIIYQLLDDVKSALSGMLDPERVETIVGIADVRDVFSSPKFGQVAGCMVIEGSVYRNKPIRVLRDNVVIFEGELESLRRFKDDVQDVRNGVECGIGVKNYDVKVGDQIEVFEVKEVAREL